MYFWTILGAVGAVASLVGLVLPAQKRSQRIVHVVYGLAITALATVAVWYWHENDRIHRVERAATVLTERADTDYTDAGFIQAALAFLEKNKDLYPDAYSRAKELCQQNNCLSMDQSGEHDSAQVHLAFALKGLIRGISALEGGS